MQALPADSTAELRLPGGVRLRLSGRALLLVVLVAVHQTMINRLPVGRLVASWSGKKVWGELVKSLPPVKLGAVAAVEEVLDLPASGQRE